MPRRDSHPLIITRDVAVIGGVLLALNIGLSRSDFGWLELNPTPWLLLPLLIGARYGLVPGTVSGLLASVVIGWMRRGEHFGGFAMDHLYELGSLPLLGFIVGQWRQLQKSRHTELELENREINEQLGSARAEVSLLLDNRLDLQRQLALQNVQVVNLDEDLRRVLTSSPSDFVNQLLELLHLRCRITSAAMYQCEGERLVQIAALHPTPPLKLQLLVDQTPLAARALEERTIASVRDPLATTQEQPFLAAFPWSDGVSNGVLLVQDMPLDALAWGNLSRIELILHWVFSLARWKWKMTLPPEGKLMSMDEFMVLIGQALQVDQTHRMPSVVLRMDMDRQTDVKLQTALLRQLPQTAVAAKIPGAEALVALLPFGGQMEGEALSRSLQQTVQGIRCCHYLTSGTTETMRFWSRVLQNESTS